MDAFGETFEEWLLHKYSAFWHLDRHSPAIVTHWFRFRISVGSVEIHHVEEDSDPSFLGGEDLGSIIFWWEKSSIHHFWGGGGGNVETSKRIGVFALSAVSSLVLPPSWPVGPAYLPEKREKTSWPAPSFPVFCHLGSKIFCSLSTWFACIGVWLWCCKALLRWNNSSILVFECGYNQHQPALHLFQSLSPSYQVKWTPKAEVMDPYHGPGGHGPHRSYMDRGLYKMSGRLPVTTYYRTMSIDNKPTTVIIGPSK